MKIYSLLSIQIRKENGKNEIGQSTRATSTSYKEIKRTYDEIAEYRINRAKKLYGGKVLRNSPMTTELSYKKDNIDILQILKIVENTVEIPEF